MYVLGKSIFTVKSVNEGKPKMKPEVQADVDKILEIMKRNGIIEIKI